MAFEDEPRTYELTFKDFPGLQVAALEPSLGEMLALQELAEKSRSTEGMRKLMQAFAKHLKSWNVTKGGEPVPADLDGLLGRSAGFIQAVTDGFIQAVVGVPDSLGKALGGGVPSSLQASLTEASIPMTPMTEPGSPGS